MQDYPVDGDKGMSQAFNGQKMLLDSPAKVRPPAVRVKDKLYFLQEMLKLSTGMYFIPQLYFESPRNEANPTASSSNELLALGNVVHLADVSNTCSFLPELIDRQ